MSDVNEFFRWKCYKGLKDLGLDSKKEYIERLEYELSVIEKMNFESYLLIVSDILNWAKDNKILISHGRGSVAGSLAAYALGIHYVDPIKYHLIFERFINPSRISMPDVDMDFQDNRRQEVLDYITAKYGKKHVAHISTYGTMQVKGAIKAAGRALGLPFEVGDSLSKMTPPPINGVPPKLSKCYEEVPQLRSYRNQPETSEGRTLVWAEQIEDRVSNAGMHPAGILIGDRPLHELIPLAKRKDIICSEWDLNEVEKVGLIKFDCLALTILNVIADALTLIKARHNKDIDIYHLPEDDTLTFQRLQAGDTIGTFQLEMSLGIRDLLIKMKPKNISDIAAVVAIYRPGPLSANYMHTWLKIRNGEEKPEYLIPELEPILSSTDGWSIYQEQSLRIAVEIAGYSLPDADNLRKIIGKKLPEEMAKQKQKFVNGVKAKGHSEAIAISLWNDMEGNAAYQFNASHAYSYGYLTYACAYLKAHYPIEYMCAAMTCNRKDVDQIIKYFFDCKDLGIKIAPPDINISGEDFTISKDKTITFGIAAIKNVGESARGLLLERQTNGPFKNMVDFIKRVDTGKLNRTKLESLILSGCFDSFGSTRASMLDVVNQLLEYKKLYKAYESKMETYHNKIEKCKARLAEIQLKNVLGEVHRLKPLSEPTKPEEPASIFEAHIAEISQDELLQHEKDLLGFYISGHPVEAYKHMGSNSIAYVKANAINDDLVEFIAIPTAVNERTTKKTGKRMASSLVEDMSGCINVTFFPKVWEQVAMHVLSKVPIIIIGRTGVIDLDDGSSAVEIRAQAVKQLQKAPQQVKPIKEIEIEITKDNIINTLTLLDKYKGEGARIRLRFKGKMFLVEPTDIISVSNADAFLREIQRDLKQ